MSYHAEDAHAGELDRGLEAMPASQQLTDDLFAAADALSAEPMLRRALTDPGLTPEGRGQLATQLFGGKVSESALTVLRSAASLRWSGGRSFADAIERQAVRSELAAALAAHTLDRVEEELFRFERLVAGDNSLREALADRGRTLEARRQLVASLLSGKEDEATIRLAQRAVAAHERTFSLTVNHYLDLAAGLRARLVAHVTAARELSADQAQRLEAALSRQAGRPVTIQVDVDPSVLGGIRVVLGDDVIEGTVAGRLNEARRQLG